MEKAKDKMFFKGKNVLVTGASKGIGRAICLEFLKLGANVFFTFRKKDSFSESLKKAKFRFSGKIYVIKCDANKIQNLKKLQKLVKKNIYKLDVLVNNVGDAFKRSKFENSKDDLWQKNINLNLMSAVRTTRFFLKMLKKSHSPCIINIGSIAGKNPGSGDSLHYSVSKSALEIFTRGLAKELKGFRVNCVAPSAIDTNFQKRLSSKKRLNKIIKATSLGRIGRPEEVSDLVVFLSSDAATYINGETIYLSGGR